MKTIWVKADEGGKVTAAVEKEQYAIGMQAVEVEDGFELSTIDDYRLQDGQLVYTGEGTAAREEAEEQAQAEAERRQAIDEGCQAFFIDGGKTKMEQDIEDAAASGGGTDPQLKALATLQIATMDLSATPCDTVVKFVDLWPDWQPDTEYKHNAPLTYDGRKFRASKDLTSQAIYPPGTAESEYYEVTLAPDGIIVWYQPGGAYNQVYKGEKRHYPDENGPVYEALDNTTYAPDAYPQHWKLVGDADTE